MVLKKRLKYPKYGFWEQFQEERHLKFWYSYFYL